MALIKVKTGGVDDTTNLGRRNLVINGAMQVAQRGTSATGVTGIAYNSMDRFRSNVNSLGTWTESQSTDAPDEFSNSFKLECTTANSSPAASAYLIVEQRIEAQNLQGLSYGTSSAKKVTLSFWVKSNVTGTYSVAIYGSDSSRANAKTFTINTASTWEYKTLTFNGDTTGNINNDNGDGFRLWWILNAGSDWKGGTQVNGVWEAYTLANLAANVTADVGGDVGDTFQITGVQLEVGDTATPFEHRSFGDELAACQRYYHKSYNYADAPATATAFGIVSSTMSQSFQNTGYIELYNVPYAVRMRTAPTITVYDEAGNSGKCNYYQGGTFVPNQTITSHRISEQRFAVYSDTSTSKGGIAFQFTADAEL